MNGDLLKTGLLLVGCSGSRGAEQAIGEARTLHPAADLMEIRLDRFAEPSSVDLAALVSGLGRPALLTLRIDREGGEFDGDLEARRAILAAADEAGCAWLDVESDLAPHLPRGKARRVVSWHGESDGDGRSRVLALRDLDCDVIKVAATVADPAAGLRFVTSAVDAGREVGKPVTAIPMGPAGRFLRPLAGRFGMPLLYTAIHSSRQTAAGQITLAEALEVYDVRNIRPDTRVFAVAGADVRRSLSPRAHNQVFRALEQGAVYVGISSDSFEPVAEVARSLPLHGLSVTAPHKLAALRFADRCSDLAREIGAANTLVRAEDGTYSADNTDAPGFLAAVDLAIRNAATCRDVALGNSLNALCQLDSTADGPARPPRVRSALLYGTGGVSRAIAHGLASRGIRVCVTGRSQSSATELALGLGCGLEAISPGRASTLSFDLLVKGVPDGAWDSLPLDPFDYSGKGLAADVVITPLETNFLLAARKAGRTTVPGVLMFAEQAVLQAVRFLGAEPAEVRPHVADGIAAGVDLAARRVIG